jgi:hypothetical protein
LEITTNDIIPANNPNTASRNSGTALLGLAGIGAWPEDVADIVCPSGYENDTVIASSPPAAKNPSVGPHTGEHWDVEEDKMTYPAKSPVSGPVSASLYLMLDSLVDIVIVLPSSPIVSIPYELELKSGA